MRDRTWLLLLPAVALLGGLFAGPLVWFLVRTLLVETAPAEVPELFVDVLAGRPMQAAMLTTLWISALVTGVTLAVGYPIAFYLANARGWRAALVLFCVIVPYFTSVIVRTYALTVVLGRAGLINQALASLGWIDAPLPLLYNTFGVVVGMACVLLPYMVLTLYATMRGIDPDLIRAARALGASGPYLFRRVYLPLSLPGIVSGSLIVLILALGFFITPALMGGPGNVTVAMLVERAIEILVDWPSAAVMSVTLLAATLVLFAVYARVTDLRRMMGA